MPLVDVVVVSYNSRDELRGCVTSLAERDDLGVFVVDNASTDGSLETVEDLSLTAIALDRNGGFAHGCNAGWSAGTAPFVLFLNPDARIEPEAVYALAGILEREPQVGIVAPRILHEDGSLDHSLRRFPRLRSTYARALFLHRLFPASAWADEVVRKPQAYDMPRKAQWVSGACMLVRRSVLDQLEGMDEGFFMYCEDKDLCRRAWSAGFEVRYEPTAVTMHIGGASLPRSSLLPVLAESRTLYARKHMSRPAELLERVGLGLESVTRLAVSRGGLPGRAGHARSLRSLARPGTSHPARPR